MALRAEGSRLAGLAAKVIQDDVKAVQQNAAEGLGVSPNFLVSPPPRDRGQGG